MATQLFPQGDATGPMDELEDHHPHKSKKKKMKSLKNLLPSRGFEFIEREPIFAEYRSNAAIKEAITAESPVLSRPKVDVLIAELFVKAKKAKDESRTLTLAGENFKKAAEDTEWCAQLPSGTISRLMMCMMQARDLHIKFSEYRKNTVDPNTEGMTARAIDAFTGKSPAAEPDDAFEDMDPEMIANRKKADWDQYSGCSSDEDVEDGDPADTGKRLMKLSDFDEQMTAGLAHLSFD
ncbi:hypothetical protein SUNI508_11180 [Seiridium unicorne]|uniref:Uncharacterized protein n=1 Tax=Seiridium unicorne TaxID=138068 RepID=A0ABR2UIL5_9PEZI